MSVESDMRAAALANSNISNLIGDRFVPGEAPQTMTLPVIVYVEISSRGERVLNGGLFVQSVRYQWRLVAERYEQIVQLAAAVRQLNGGSYGEVMHIEVNDGPDGFDFETSRYVRVMDVLANRR